MQIVPLPVISRTTKDIHVSVSILPLVRPVVRRESRSVLHTHNRSSQQNSSLSSLTVMPTAVQQFSDILDTAKALGEGDLLCCGTVSLLLPHSLPQELEKTTSYASFKGKLEAKGT